VPAGPFEQLGTMARCRVTSGGPDDDHADHAKGLVRDAEIAVNASLGKGQMGRPAGRQAQIPTMSSRWHGCVPGTGRLAGLVGAGVVVAGRGVPPGHCSPHFDAHCGGDEVKEVGGIHRYLVHRTARGTGGYRPRERRSRGRSSAAGEPDQKTDGHPDQSNRVSPQPETQDVFNPPSAKLITVHASGVRPALPLSIQIDQAEKVRFETPRTSWLRTATPLALARTEPTRVAPLGRVPTQLDWCTSQAVTLALGARSSSPTATTSSPAERYQIRCPLPRTGRPEEGEKETNTACELGSVGCPEAMKRATAAQMPSTATTMAVSTPAAG